MSDLLLLLARSEIDLQHRGLGYQYQRLTNPLVGAFGTHLTWPPSIAKHRCAMSEVSLWVDDRELVGTVREEHDIPNWILDDFGRFTLKSAKNFFF